MMCDLTSRFTINVLKRFLSGFTRFCSEAFYQGNVHLLAYIYDALWSVLLFEWQISSQSTYQTFTRFCRQKLTKNSCLQYGLVKQQGVLYNIT